MSVLPGEGVAVPAERVWVEDAEGVGCDSESEMEVEGVDEPVGERDCDADGVGVAESGQVAVSCRRRLSGQ